MDQLQSILVHKFWILLGVAILVCTAGWWMATGDLEAKIETRTTEVQGAFEKVPSGNDLPNQGWVKSLNDVNADERKSLNEAAAYLWQVQDSLITWPEDLLSLNIDGKQFSELQYGEDMNIFPHRGEFMTEYYDQFDKLRAIVDPYVARTEEGKVAIGRNFFTNWVPQGTWSISSPPSSAAVWDAQEDVWLCRSILQAIAAVNKDAANISEANIKIVEQVSLHGGGAGRGSATGKGAKVKKGRGDVRLGLSRDDEEDSRRDRRKSTSTGFDFDVTQEFGAGTGRYVEETPLYRTRGFVVKVTMDHRRLPDFVAQLTAMPWPAYIARIHQREANPPSQPPGGGPPKGATEQIADTRSNRNLGLGLGRREEEEDRPSRPTEKSEESLTLYEAVITDPYLAEVLVAGVMTIYKQPEGAESLVADAGAAPSPKAAANGSVPADQGQPTDGDSEEQAATNDTQQPAAESEESPPDESPPDDVPAEGTNPDNAEPTSPPADNENEPGTEPAEEPQPAGTPEGRLP